MKLRSFRLSDYPHIIELFRDVLSEACFETTMEAFGRQLSWDSDLVIVAETDDRPVGVIIGTIDKNQGYYYRIAVARGYQRQGIGTALIHKLRERFENRKVSKIYVTVDNHNEPILPLYESAGYHSEDFFRSYDRLSIVSG
ncbi:GNAT family N-acetyltransferase [Paenibacillus thermoaerophilus]|jgi:ribosomal protein S18 acetylase RimI-like enzyme|uniref:GNAT family N-acetyltransferase n=1 Tax=Paenibacillus thermoaerophilus TaxID=1215385 RepID=A0ABW2V3L7_9BACL|nr:GNAT family N-acetyltransferase [Paenibacillus thermoaerophilus]